MFIAVILIITPPLSNKKASNKKLDSQISYFSRKSKDLIMKSNENSLLRDKKSRLSLEKSSFLLDGRGCSIITINVIITGKNEESSGVDLLMHVSSLHPLRSNKK